MIRCSIGRSLVAEPPVYRYDNVGGSIRSTEPPGELSLPDFGPWGRWARAFGKPNLLLGAAIVLLNTALFFTFMYTAMGHFIAVNIPQPDPVPQWVLDVNKNMGVSIPTPGPDHIRLNETDEAVRLMLVASIIIFVIWPLVALGLHVIAKLFGGKGSFAAVTAAIGYSYVPKVVALILAIFIVWALPVYQIDASTYHSGDIAGLVDGNISFPAIKLVLDAGIIGSSCLGVVAIRYAERVSWPVAALIVGVPLLICLLYSLL